MENQDIKILVVDDEPDIIHFIKYNLEKEGFNVISAKNGAQALELVKEEHPDLIILDIMMPELDGVEVCRQIRQDSNHQNVLITFLTARSEDYSQIAALDVGGDDYITKPIRPRVLVSRIKALLRRKMMNGGESEHKIMHQMGKKPSREKELVDQIAAQRILQSYMGL